MSFNLQRQVRENAVNLRETVTDIYKWVDEIEGKKTVPKKQKKDDYQQPIRGQANNVEVQEEKTEDRDRKRLTNPKQVRDGNTIKDYYDAWDKFDPEKAEKDLEEKTKNVTKEWIDTRQSNEEGKKKSAGTKLIVEGGRNLNKNDLEIMKEHANNCFKERNFIEAIEEYGKCLKQIE